MNKIKKSVVDVALEDLNDAPDYTGNKNKIVSVKTDESGVEFINSYKSGLYQNAIINGDMKIAQRGTSFTGLGSVNAVYTIDRWMHGISNFDELDFNVEQDDIDAPTSKFNYSMKIDIITEETTLAVDELLCVTQYIEGYNFKPFVGGYGTLSFWVKSNKTGIYCISFSNSGYDRVYITEYTINSADTWEFKELTLQFNYSDGGTWNYTNGRGIGIAFIFASGSDYYGVKDTWLTTNDHATSNQVDLTDSADNYIKITGVQLNEGEVTLPFQHRHFSHELELCQRYYCKTYKYSVIPGTITNDGIVEFYISNIANAIHSAAINWDFPRTMRIAPPTVTTYNSTTGNSGKVRVNASEVNSTIQSESNNKCVIVGTDTGVAVSVDIYFQATADAEL